MVFNVFYALAHVYLALLQFSAKVAFKAITYLEVAVLPVTKNVQYVLLHQQIVKHAIPASISVDQLVLLVPTAAYSAPTQLIVSLVALASSSNLQLTLVSTVLLFSPPAIFVLIHSVFNVLLG